MNEGPCLCLLVCVLEVESGPCAGPVFDGGPGWDLVAKAREESLSNLACPDPGILVHAVNLQAGIFGVHLELVVRAGVASCARFAPYAREIPPPGRSRGHIYTGPA